jgi:hypothetical protein
MAKKRIPGLVSFGMNVDVNILEMMRQLCDQNNTSISAVTREWMYDYVKKNWKGEMPKPSSPWDRLGGRI